MHETYWIVSLDAYAVNSNSRLNLASDNDEGKILLMRRICFEGCYAASKIGF